MIGVFCWPSFQLPENGSFATICHDATFAGSKIAEVKYFTQRRRVAAIGQTSCSESFKTMKGYAFVTAQRIRD